MLPVITVENMRLSDADTIARFIPGKELMYRAAFGVYQAVHWQGSVAILVGGGNNGGDGYALASILAEHGIQSCVYRVSDKFSEDGAYYYELAKQNGVQCPLFHGEEDLSCYDILVDCLLGTGFSGVVRGKFRQAIDAINAAHSYVVSVDINSGMNGDTGKGEPIVRSDITIAIGYLKCGFFWGRAAQHMKKLVVADIGIRLLKEEFYLADPEEIAFPESGLTLKDNTPIILVPEMIEDKTESNGSFIRTAQAIAGENGCLVHVQGISPLITDGNRVYFVASERGQVIYHAV